MAKYGQANARPGEIRRTPDLSNAVWSGGGMVAPGGYDPAQDPNWVKPNARKAAGREKGNQKDYFRAELEKKYGGKIPSEFQDDVEKYGWKPGGQYSYTENIRNNKTGKVEKVTKTFEMPAGSTIEQYTNQGYTPSNNYKAAYDPYALRGQDPTLSKEFTVSPYGSTQQSNQQGGQNMAQYPANNSYYNPNESTGGFNPNTFSSSLSAQGASPAQIAELKKRALAAGQFGPVPEPGQLGPTTTGPYQLPGANGWILGGVDASKSSPGLGGQLPRSPQTLSSQSPQFPQYSEQQLSALAPRNYNYGGNAGGGARPTVFNPNFAQSPAGSAQMGRPMAMNPVLSQPFSQPYQMPNPRNRQFKNTVW